MIYFDSAATTLQKPKSVSRATAYALDHMASVGRGNSGASLSAAELLFRCREAAARMFDVPSPENVVFTFNATHALNIAIQSLVKPGQTVLISGYEHNAVRRPLAVIPGIQVRVLDTPLFDHESFLAAAEQELERGVDAVVCTHVSNVFGYILPIEPLAQRCARAGVPLIVDASQSAGILPISMAHWGAAFVAMPGHKGLYGPQGTGLLLCAAETQPLLYGGTGSLSAQLEMPDFLPDRLEAGTHNLPGLAGLLQGMDFVRKTGEAKILCHEQGLRRSAARGLRELAGVECFEAQDDWRQSGVLSFRVAGRDCEELSEALARNQIAVRSGLHCAPLAHQSAQTIQTGTVRLSFSHFNSPQQLTRFFSVLRGMLL